MQDKNPEEASDKWALPKISREAAILCGILIVVAFFVHRRLLEEGYGETTTVFITTLVVGVIAVSWILYSSYRGKRFQKHLAEGEAAYKLKDYSSALIHYNKALEYCQHKIFEKYIRLAIAQIYLDRGDTERGIEELSRNRDFWLARHHLAGYYLNKGDLEKAKEIYEEGIREVKAEAPLYSGLAYTLQKQGDVGKAKEILEQAISKFPDSKNLLKHLKLLESGEEIQIGLPRS
ncbi:MAG: tetratricopeptide repeat protein [Planctomycetes bacterium]|nr:tetratricopeptide repeat protein [Planctomycetota bacterium]